MPYTIKVEIPEDICNECKFFVYGVSCGMGFPQYSCSAFGEPLHADVHKEYKSNKRLFETEYVAYPCKECKKKRRLILSVCPACSKKRLNLKTGRCYNCKRTFSKATTDIIRDELSQSGQTNLGEDEIVG